MTFQVTNLTVVFMTWPFQPDTYDRFIKNLQDSCANDPLYPISPYLISPYTLVLTRTQKELLEGYIQKLASVLPLDRYGGFALAADWHWSWQQNNWFLIEVNTNAAFLGLSQVLYETWGYPRFLSDDDICRLFLDWIQPLDDQELAIVDDHVMKQRLVCEFQWFSRRFRKCFQKVSLKNPWDISGSESGIYNRLVDFELQEPEHEKIKAYYEQYPKQITPNPEDYRQVAHKKWLIELSQNPLTQVFVPETFWIKPDKAAWLWENRKDLFFKPAQSHGSKGVYNGKTISRKHFEAIVNHKTPYLAQKRVDPPVVNTPQHGPLKWDLRVYLHKGQILGFVARIWQGQATNSQTPGGGFAPIVWV